MLNTILLYIWNNKNLMMAMKNIVGDNKHTLDDFKSHFIEQIIDTDINKLTTLYNSNQLDWFCIKVMTNQYKSGSSSFYKEFKNRGKSGNKIIEEDYTILIDEVYVEYGDHPEDILKHIEELLKIQYKNTMVNHYHKTLFEMYHFRKLKLKEITKLTSINKDAISRSVRKTTEYLKINTNYGNN